MPGKNKKREKYSGLLLSRIGACLVPGAVFAAVPSTARTFSETWPRRRKNLSALSTALGSVGNLAQAVVVAEGSRKQTNEEAGTSKETLNEYENYGSEGHYEDMNENIRYGNESRDSTNTKDDSVGPPVEAIYATVNKRKKPKTEVKESSSSGSEDDITNVSGMGSEEDEDDSHIAINQRVPTSNTYSKKQSSKKRKSSKNKSGKNVPRDITEDPVVKTDVNDNQILKSVHYDDDIVEEPYSPTLETLVENDFFHSTEYAYNSKPQNVSGAMQRNFHSPTEFEREQFNETDPYDFSDEGTQPNQLRRREFLLGASAPDLTNCPPDVPPIGERETPIGKRMSSESISSSKERWNELAHSVVKQESINQSRLREQILCKNHKENQQHGEEKIIKKQIKKSERRKRFENEEEFSHNEQLALSQERLGDSKRFSQSALLAQQQIEVANKLRALSAQGSYTLESLNRGETDSSRKSVHSLEARVDNQATKQGNQSVVSPELDSNRNVTHNEERAGIDDEPSKLPEQFEDIKTPKRRKKKRKDQEINESPVVAEVKDRLPSLQNMPTTMAKEACRQLYLQVKTLDREKLALESLTQSLNEENTTLKKLNDSLTRNVDTPISGTSIGESLQTQEMEEIKQENSFLKDSVHRLNVELGRYQAKCRLQPSQDLHPSLKAEDNQPPWLVDKKIIAPLFLAYDDRIAEKQAIIQNYEGQLKTVKNSLCKITQENAQLQEKIGNVQTIMHDDKEWQHLEKQAALVLSENEVLMERQELQNQKLEELTTFYKNEVTQLSKQHQKAEVEKSGLESKLEVMNTTINGYKQELENSSSQWRTHVSVEEHLNTVNDCRRKLEELRKKTQEEIDSLTFQLQSTRDKNKSLSMQLAELKLTNTQLEREVHTFTEVQRKHERSTLLLKEKLNHIQQREAAAQDTLNEVLKVAEKTALERDALSDMLTNKQLENEKVHSLIKMEEDKVKECKNKASLKITAIRGRVKEQEEAAEMLKYRYENEIKTLKNLIHCQQSQLEDMVYDKRNLENELNVIYEKVGDSNHILKDVT